MKITKIDTYRVELPLVEGSYKWSGGNSVSVFDSTVVAISTDAGITGFGEICPLGSAYLPAYANGARTGIAELGPYLLGLDLDGNRAAQSTYGSGPAWTSLRQIAARYGVLGHFGQSLWTARRNANGRTIRR